MASAAFIGTGGVAKPTILIKLPLEIVKASEGSLTALSPVVEITLTL